MTQPEGIIAKPVNDMEHLMAVGAIAASRGLEFDLNPPEGQTWVYAAQEEDTGEIVGAAVVHIPPSIFDTQPAELLYDVVKPEKHGRGIGNLLIKKAFESVRVTTGRDMKVAKEIVESNQADFEDRKIRPADVGSYLLFVA